MEEIFEQTMGLTVHNAAMETQSDAVFDSGKEM